MSNLRVLITCALALVSFSLVSCGGGSSSALRSDTGASTNAPQRPPVVVPSEGGDASSIVTSPGTLTNPGAPGGTVGAGGGIPGGTGINTGTHGTAAIGGPRFKNRKLSVEAGLGFLAMNQGSFTVSDAGIHGPYDLWQWYVGAGQAPRNIQGEIIDYTLRSSMLLPGNNDFDEMALAAIDDWLVPHVTVNNPTGRGFAFEVGALLAAAERTGDSSYAQLAADLAMRTVDDVADGPGDGKFTGAEYADRFITNRKSLGGWDAGPYALYFDAAGAAVGGAQGAALQQWSRDLLDRMWERKADWEYVPWSGQFLFTHGAWGLLLQAYATVEADAYSEQCDYFRGMILAEQNADGYWVWGYAGDSDAGDDDLQATYSCLLGLDADGRANTIQARKGGESYLTSKDIQQASGGFNGYIGDPGPLNNELCAEATYGIAVGLNRGKN